MTLLYLEGRERAEIADVTGRSRENVALKVHRIRTTLGRSKRRRQ